MIKSAQICDRDHYGVLPGIAVKNGKNIFSG